MHWTHQILIAVRDYLQELGLQTSFKASYAGSTPTPVGVPCTVAKWPDFATEYGIRLDPTNNTLIVWAYSLEWPDDIYRLGVVELSHPGLFDMLEDWLRHDRPYSSREDHRLDTAVLSGSPVP